ncbi:MAG: hypothetical protein KDD82_26575, partial [Planctomycetes bacterium]|nr:hypothetical protein [Planctomycetota bacterium]
MEEDQAKRIVSQALSLGVLLEEDVASVGKDQDQDPVGLLVALQKKAFLTPDLVDALTEVVKAQTPRKKRRRAAAVGAGSEDTLAPERSDEEFDTLAPERDDDAFLMPGSLKSDFLAASSFMDELESHTLAPEREGELEVPGGAAAEGTLDGGTNAGTLAGGGTVGGSG